MNKIELIKDQFKYVARKLGSKHEIFFKSIERVFSDDEYVTVCFEDGDEINIPKIKCLSCHALTQWFYHDFNIKGVKKDE
jgi:3-methyladenine DNA glycosylase AlkD